MLERDDKQQATAETRRDESPTVPGRSRGGVAPGRLAPGTHVGRYEVIEVLGAGAMGVVYRARDARMVRHVAVKVLNPQRQGVPGGEDDERLLREAQVLAQLSHPNVVAAYDVGTYEGSVFVALELIDGISLREWLEQPRSSAMVLRVMIAAGRGLAAAHAAGVMHRDFKPDNVMVSPDGRVRVVDFGLARGAVVGDLASAATSDEGNDAGRAASPSDDTDGDDDDDDDLDSVSALSRDLTQAGVVFGTPGYMAPEQLMGTAVDVRADQFGYAATVFRALVGQRPHPSDTFEDYRRAVTLGERLPWPRSVSRRLRRVVDRGLENAPEQRYPSLDALVDDLERAAKPRLGRLVLIAGVAIAAAVAIAIAVLARRPGPACTLDRGAFTAVWSAGARDELERAFGPAGAVTARVVGERLDDAARRWGVARQEACEATQVQGRQSERVLALREACLDRKRRDVATFVALFRDPTPGLLEKAPDAVIEVTDLHACDDVVALLGESDQLPTDSATRAAIAVLEVDLDATRVVVLSGHYEAGRARLDELVPRAAQAGYGPLHARALLLQSSALREQQRDADADALAREALAIATDAKDDLESAEAATQLLHSAVKDYRWQEATAMVPLVDSLTRRLPSSPQRVHCLLDRAAVASAARDYPTVLATLALAELTCATIADAGAADCYRINEERQFIYIEQDDWVHAAEASRLVIVDATKVFGPDHPRLFTRWKNLVTILAKAGDRDGALVALAEARRIAGHMAASPATEAMLAEAEANMIAEIDEDYARTLPLRERALARSTEAFGPSSQKALRARLRLGHDLAEMGRAAEGVAHLEAALAATRAANRSVTEEAQYTIELARALWHLPEQRRRAVELGRAAEQTYRDAGAGFEVERADAADWLAGHVLPGQAPAQASPPTR